MKSFKYTAAILLVAISFGSCKKFLEEDPQNLVTIGNYYKTEQDAISAVNSIYAYLNSTSTGSTAGIYHSSFWVAAGLSSDELENNQLGTPYFDELSTFTPAPNNATLQEVWQMHYKTITIANLAITRIPGIDMNTTLRSRLVGEAKFLRALMYFNLVRMFGEIPLLVEENAPLTPGEASVDAIYTQIISDLTDAAPVLPDSYPVRSGRGRATVGAANGLLAKVYLTRGEWQKAADAAELVINSQLYDLWQDYAQVFKHANRNGKEAVFSVSFGDAGGAIIFWEVGQFNVRLLPTALSVEGVQNAQGWQRPTMYSYNQFEADDRRKTVTFLTEIQEATGPATIRPYIQKYWDRETEPKGNASSADFPVIRYADILLMYAEANNELNRSDLAHQYINRVRKRARFDGSAELSAVADYNGLSKEAMRDAILKERMLEFHTEGHRWFDLVRMGKLEERVAAAKPGVTPGTRNYLFPIPLRELDLNPNLSQNTGY